MELTRYYLRDSTVPFEEDAQHEFKGHSNITEGELPGWVNVPSEAGRRTRQPLCKALTAFLNTGAGGNVYIGIHDDGVVRGLPLTRLQRDHMLVAIRDMMESCRPPVPAHRYSIRFVPVLTQEEARHFAHANQPIKIDDELPRDVRMKPHSLQTSAYCDCDFSAISDFNAGCVIRSYVTHIRLSVWDPDDPDCRREAIAGLERLPPLYETSGETYIRCSGTVKRLLPEDVMQLQRGLTLQHYGRHLHSLRQRRLKLLSEINKLQGNSKGLLSSSESSSA